MVALPPKVGGLTAPPTGSKIADKFLADKVAELEKAAAAKATPAPIAPAAPAPIAPAPVLEAAPQLPVKEKRKPKLPGNEPPYAVQHQIIQVGEHVWEFTHKGKLTFPDGTQQLTAAAPAGAMNAATYYAPVTPLITSATGQTLAQYTFTSNGNPVLCIANGDGNPLSLGGNWVQIQWYRDGAPIGNKFHLENNQNINPSYCATVLDTPAAGPHVYSLRTVPGVYNGSWVFGEAAGPILTFVELAGAVGPKGEPGVGVGTTQVQNSITLGAITTAPAVAKRTVERIESQTIGDKVRLTYKLGQVSAAAGSGHYLLSLPTGMSFNQTYNPVWTANEWQGGVNALAPYHIPAMGGIVIDGNWSNQVMVVPYDSTRFRVLFSNNNSQTTYGFWHSGWYATSAASGISLNLQFEIWK